MGKSIKGKELGKGITQRKSDGLCESFRQDADHIRKQSE